MVGVVDVVGVVGVVDVVGVVVAVVLVAVVVVRVRRVSVVVVGRSSALTTSVPDELDCSLRNYSQISPRESKS